MNRISFMYKDRLLKPSDSLSHELDTRYLELDGWERTLERLELELVWAWVKTKEDRNRVGFNKKFFHDAKNVLVEFNRCAPWAVVTLSLLALPINLGLIGFLAF